MAAREWISTIAVIVTLLNSILSTDAATIPSPRSVGSDLRILLHNDLYGNSSTRQDAVIVLSTAQTQETGQKSCEAIGENLWSPPALNSSSGGAAFLRYLDYDSPRAGSRLYWTQGGTNGSCNAFTPLGKVENVNCRTALPVLCSQSAPLSSPAVSDSSSRWQTAVISGKQIFTGYRDKLSFRFLGVRYAAQPDRFSYSNPYSGAGNSSALAFGPQCIQAGCNSTKCSEDCLFLNIWTSFLPRANGTSKSELKPVMFWIHGGGFTGGTGSDPTFDGGNMASRGDVVVVTINYRLTTLGFLALNDGITNGNYGIADQITALEWVQAHITDFGGDPDRVTIFGQSAGAASVRALLSSPKAVGKFAAAIPQSNLAGLNYATTYSQYYSVSEEVSAAANTVLNATGCTDPKIQLQCLKAYDPYKLASLSSVARFVVVDGTYITSNQLPLSSTGNVSKVPVLTGLMRDDGGPFIGYPTTTNVSQALSAQSFNANSILRSGDFPTPQGSNITLNVFNVTSRVATDAEFRCLDQATAYAAVRNNVFPVVYFYEFNRGYQLIEWSPNPPTCQPPASDSHPYGDPEQEYFKCHSGELYYVFGTFIRQGLPPRDELDVPFSQLTLDTWTAFARSHNPNPDRSYLSARGYANTTNFIARAGIWNSVDASHPMQRTLQLPTILDEAFTESKQCEALGLPLNFYMQKV